MRAFVPPCLFLLALALPGCFVVTDLGRFKEAEPNNELFYDLQFTIRGADSHVTDMFELRVVDERNEILARMISAPLGASTATFNLPLSLPKSTPKLRLFFFADHNKTGKFEPPPDDHSWKVNVDDFKPKEASDNLVRVEFAHTFQFETITGNEFGNPATVKMKNMGAYLNKQVIVRVSDASSGQLAGQYRIPQLTQPSADAAIPGIIDKASGTRYAVRITVDDGTPAAGGLEGFRLEKASETVGLNVDFDPARDANLRDPGPLPRP